VFGSVDFGVLALREDGRGCRAGGGEGCESGWVTVSRQPVRSGRGFLWGCRLVVGKGIGDA